MARRLFGTDGVRGVAGELLTAELALALGRAAVEQIGVEHPRVLLIRDTRESGEMLEAALAAGVASAGGDVFLGGVLPTPGAPLLIATRGFDLAAVISASHNPYRDNGIKFFGADGYKLSDATEQAIEDRLDAPPLPPTRIGRVDRIRGTDSEYLAAIADRFGTLDLSGTKVLLDCANGATFHVAPAIFRRLRAQVTVLNDEPDGRNINEGSRLHPRRGARGADARGRPRHRLRLRRRRRPRARGGPQRRRRRRGRAHRPGRRCTCARPASCRQRRRGDRHDELRLPHGDARQRGIEVATTGVGDRYVLEELRRAGVGARRRAVRPHHRSRLQPLRRRHRRGAAHPRGAGRRRSGRAARGCSASRSGS